MNKRICLLCVMWSVSWSPPLLGDSFFISSSEEAGLTAPRAACSANGDRYLVAWESRRWGDRYGDVHCRLIDAQGQPLTDLIELQASRTAEKAIWCDPDVACNSLRDEFLLVYSYSDEYTVVARDGVRGQIIASDGSLGRSFAVDPDGFRRATNPAVAYGLTHDDYLVVWVRNHNQIWAQAVESDGALKGSLLRVDPGVPDCNHPAVACGSGQYLVVWQQEDDNGRSAIHAQRVSVGYGGAALLGGLIDCEESQADQMFPRVAYDSARDEYLVVWQTGSFAGDGPMIRGQRVGADGSVHDAFAVASGGSSYRARPDVVAARTMSGYFVTWEAAGIVVQYVGPTGRIWGQPQRISSFPPLELDQHPALALTSDGRGLVVWDRIIFGIVDPWPPLPPRDPWPPLPPFDLDSEYCICGSVDPEWMCVRPVARIDSPGFLESVCGTYEIRGETCDAQSLDSYTLEYRNALASSESPWTAIGRWSAPVCGSGLLATWDTQDLEPGPYYLRLVVTNADGLEATDFVAVQIEVCDN